MGASNADGACVRVKGVTGYMRMDALGESRPVEVEGGAITKAKSGTYAFAARDGVTVYESYDTASTRLAELLAEANEKEPIRRITLIGLCTDICVISNAVLVRTAQPETDVTVDASCCASNDPILGEKALDVMESLQIVITGRKEEV